MNDVYSESFCDSILQGSTVLPKCVSYPEDHLWKCVSFSLFLLHIFSWEKGGGGGVGGGQSLIILGQRALLINHALQNVSQQKQIDIM